MISWFQAFTFTCNLYRRYRKALLERDAFVLDGFMSPLRAPPTVYQGLSTVPFSMFRNGLLHTGRSAHSGPTGVNVTWTFKTGGRVFSSPTLVRLLLLGDVRLLTWTYWLLSDGLLAVVRMVTWTYGCSDCEIT
jgi:hypothetical protein